MNYEKIGVKAGLEIHQQLDTGKLFCRCPGYLRKDAPDFVVSRKLHAVPGELGEVDIAVEYEAELAKEFEYQGYNDSTCLVELDEEPPHMINESALKEAQKIALLLNCEIYPVAQIMRKSVIDGSNTSGFQRTVLIGHDGYVETNFGKVRIETIALEEDAARIVKRGKDKVIFRLDRLGIPLVEVTTKPDMGSAKEIKETALKIGEILRACKVKRGIGTIRQDLNISIKGHDRVEIKGFQDPKIMIKTIDSEIKRQQKDVEDKKKKGEVRNALASGKTEFLRPIPGRARMYPETDLPILNIPKKDIDKLKRELPKLRSEVKEYLEKKGLSDELINLILIGEGNLDEFETLMRVYNEDANLIGKMISLWRSEFASKLKLGGEEIKMILSEAVFERVLKALNEGKIIKRDVKGVLTKIASGASVEEALKIERIKEDELEAEIRKIAKQKPGLSPNAYMGIIMGKFKKEIDAKEAMEIVNKITGEE